MFELLPFWERSSLVNGSYQCNIESKQRFSKHTKSRELANRFNECSYLKLSYRTALDRHIHIDEDN